MFLTCAYRCKKVGAMVRTNGYWGMIRKNVRKVVADLSFYINSCKFM